MATAPGALGITIEAGACLRLERWRHSAIALPCWRWYWNDRPGWSVLHRGQRWSLGPDRILLVAPETVYKTHSTGPAEHRFIHFTCAGLAAAPGIHRLTVDAAWRRLVADFAAAGEQPGRDRLVAGACAARAIAELPAAVWTPPEHSPRIQQALDHLTRHLDRSVGGAELAAHVGMNPNALIRRFRRELGLTPHQWQLRARIERACAALAEPDARIEAVAEALGFCDRHHFTRWFTRLRGLAPAAYRRALQHQLGGDPAP